MYELIRKEQHTHTLIQTLDVRVKCFVITSTLSIHEVQDHVTSCVVLYSYHLQQPDNAQTKRTNTKPNNNNYTFHTFIQRKQKPGRHIASCIV